MLQAEKTERTHQEFLKAARTLFLKLWSDFVERYIQDSISDAMKTETLEEAINDLILKNKEYFSHPMFSCYYSAGIPRVWNHGRDYTPNGAKYFTMMLYRLLLREYPDAEEKRLRTYASTLHAVINAYSSSEALEQDFYFDEITIREILMSIASQAGR